MSQFRLRSMGLSLLRASLFSMQGFPKPGTYVVEDVPSKNQCFWDLENLCQKMRAFWSGYLIYFDCS